MPNSRYSNIGQVKKTNATYSDPKRGSDSVPSLNMTGPNWPGLPGKAGPDRSGGFGKEVKIYAQGKGIEGS